MLRNNIKSKVFFHLCRFAGRDILLWLFSEWDYMLPTSLIKNRVIGKPIFLGSTHDIEDFEGTHPKRIYQKRKWYDLTIKMNIQGKEDINSDKEILTVLSCLLGIDLNANDQQIFSLAALPRDNVMKSFGDMGKRARNIKKKKETKRIASEISMITGIPISNIGITGSRILGMCDPRLSDYDLSLYCEYNEMIHIKKRIRKYKEMPSYNQELKYSGLHFPLKITLKNGKSVDLFFKPIEESHPTLRGLKNMQIVKENHLCKFKIKSTSFAFDGWPILEVIEEPSTLIIMCNGFRGVFDVGMVFTCQAKLIKIEYFDSTDMLAYVISDPFHEIKNVNRLFT